MVCLVKERWRDDSIENPRASANPVFKSNLSFLFVHHKSPQVKWTVQHAEMLQVFL